MNLRPLPPQGSALPAAPHPDLCDLYIIAQRFDKVNREIEFFLRFFCFFRKFSFLNNKDIYCYCGHGRKAQKIFFCSTSKGRKNLLRLLTLSGQCGIIKQIFFERTTTMTIKNFALNLNTVSMRGVETTPWFRSGLYCRTQIFS